MTDPSSTESSWDRFEPIAKMLPLVLAGLYVLGFIIVAFHLAAFGASSLELVRIQYLAAGFWFVLSFVFFEGITQLTHRLYTYTRPEWSQRTAPTIIMGIVLTILIWAVILPFFSPLRLTFTFLLALDVVLRIRLLVQYSVPTFASGWMRKVFQVFDFTRPLADLLLVIAVMMGVVCAGFFAKDVYPKIPFTLGGGQPRQVVFWLGSNNSDSFLERDSASKSYSIPYDLLLENENSFVVISPKNGQKVVEIDRKTVNAVIVLGEKRQHLP